MAHSLQDLSTIDDAEWIRSPATQRVFALLNQHGFVGRAVGGCVRNSLLKRLQSDDDHTIAPVTDIDFATTATPDQTLALAAAAGLRTVPTGLQHGTVTIIVHGEGFEVTTLRRDLATDGRHAEVAFTDDWALDAARRDLTINALYADADGTIFDPLGGLPDLHLKRIRFVGEARKRIQEDYLRILRFFRFFAQYGSGLPDGEGLAACIAERRGLARLSSERIHQELMKLLLAPGAAGTLKIMADHGLLTEVLPTVPQLNRLERLIPLDQRSDRALRLAGLCVQTSEDAQRITQHLKLSRNETAILNLAATIQAAAHFEIGGSNDARRHLYNLGVDDYIRTITFLRALTPNLLSVHEWQQLMDLPDNWQIPAPPIAGRDIIKLGAKPGPIVGEIIQKLEQCWIDSDFSLERDFLIQKARSLLNRRSASQ